ncbi:MAG: phosphatidylglycerophosphatase A [Bacteroidota bacterium]|nr:phosphatidylglycerophosphatase A [Bacteroidota bacterium]
MTTGNSSGRSSVHPRTPRTEQAPPFLVRFIAGGCFTGYFPFAPGTVGSALALALYCFIPGMERWQTLLPLCAASLLAGIPLASRMERSYGPDPSAVVLDEIAGMWVALLFLPKIWYISIGAFLLFRAFDVVKPPPARQFDRMRGGFGIMMDDIVAGVYANICTQLLRIVV